MTRALLKVALKRCVSLNVLTTVQLARQTWIALSLSHQTLRLGIPVLSLFIYLFFPSSFHLSSRVCPFLSVLYLLLPSPSLVFFIFYTELNPTFLHTLIHSVHLPVWSFASSHHASITDCWALRHTAHTNSVLHQNLMLNINYKILQMASYWTDECFDFESELGTLLVFYLWCLLFLCARVCSPPFWRWGATRFLTPRTCLCWPDVNQLVPRLFSLAEYGSAGERSRRAKKRNIGRYT